MTKNNKRIALTVTAICLKRSVESFSVGISHRGIYRPTINKDRLYPSLGVYNIWIKEVDQL